MDDHHLDNLQEEIATIPYYVHEGDMAREERNRTRLLIALVLSLAISLAFLFANNLAWIIYNDRKESRYAAERQVISEEMQSQETLQSVEDTD
jgi:hypothetical protein